MPRAQLFDDDVHVVLCHSAIRALHNMSLMEAERYVKAGGQPRLRLNCTSPCCMVRLARIPAASPAVTWHAPVPWVEGGTQAAMGLRGRHAGITQTPCPGQVRPRQLQVALSEVGHQGYTGEGGPARRLSSYSSIRPSSSEPQLPPPSGPTSTMRGHTAHSRQAQVSCQLCPGCKPAPGPSTRPVPGSSCSASLCSAAGCCLGHLIIEHALRICSYPSLADTSAAVCFLPALAQLQSFTSCFVA
ncbi:hypothetical protein HaLaN_25730 [Haematococcus lacustris]|uniref:Uncharacterized protein n=1 Tax=Haematococcus lacustris TaxID=44745 RepID=A0A699ZXN4_HAELA|nr:hypothetical protein HaLaN_25730 [Haematococcus lacustris]